MGYDNKDLLSVINLLKKYCVFGMDKFDNRIIFQKAVYFAQQKGMTGLNDYNFNWYIYGPYCPKLTEDGFKIDASKNTHKSFQETKDMADLENFLGNEKIADPIWMEVLASIHFLKRIYPSKTKEEIITMVKSKQPYIEKKACIKAWNQLEKCETKANKMFGKIAVEDKNRLCRAYVRKKLKGLEGRK